MSGGKGGGREARVLARPLAAAGELKSPGDTVCLHPDQIDRLEPEGYFEPAKPPAKRKSTQTGGVSTNGQD